MASNPNGKRPLSSNLNPSSANPGRNRLPPLPNSRPKKIPHQRLANLSSQRFTASSPLGNLCPFDILDSRASLEGISDTHVSSDQQGESIPQEEDEVEEHEPNSGWQIISDGRDYYRRILVQRLTNLRDVDCQEQLRMGKNAFANLVYLIRQRGLLQDSTRSNVEEWVARFLHILAYDLRNRVIKFSFIRSGETVSRHFHDVLKAIISLEDIFLRQPNGEEYLPQIKNDSSYWPYFKDCVGAIDGTHFRVKVSNDDVPRYRGRKNYPTQNVLVACTFDLKFIYVLPGWEGSTSDSRVLNDALTREIDRLVVPQGKYYLADAGYQLKTGFLTPYRSTRYHIKEYDNYHPKNGEELFNYHHALLRNAIERTFGILKKQFEILWSGAEPYYNVDTQGDIIVACCILHNYLMGVDPFEDLLAEVVEELNKQATEDGSMISSLIDKCREGEYLREKIAFHMWRDYTRNRLVAN